MELPRDPRGVAASFTKDCRLAFNPAPFGSFQEEIEVANAIERHCPSLAIAGTFAKEFVQLLKEQRVNELDCWIARVAEPNVPSELRTICVRTEKRPRRRQGGLFHAVE